MSKQQLKPHHKAWLQSHPERSAEWLQEMLADGFQVHHIDGDHANDHPYNLALIETTDHMRLHGIFRLQPPNINFMREIGRKGGLIMNRKRRILKARGRKGAVARWGSEAANVES